MRPPLLAGLPLLLLALAGCTPAAPDNASDGVLRIVASTDVYGDLAAEIGGPDVEVTSIIDDADQDPHQFEANGRVQLALSRADIVVVNGGGYDDFARTMLAASGNDDARVIDAVALSGYDSGVDGFNEHVWFDYPAVQTVVKAIGAALGIADPAESDTYDARAEIVVAEIDALIQIEASVAAGAGGDGVVITEPVPLYALEACGLRNLTPPEFSEAIEEDTDIPPAVLQSVLNLIGDGSASVVVYNEQTGGPQTDAILDIASENRIPVIGVSETLPEGMSYFEWQSRFLRELQQAVLT